MAGHLPVDRYVAAGLTHNPFAAARTPSAADLNVAALFVDRGLPDPPSPGSKTLVQVIAQSGFGKSTQLRHWRSLAPGPYHYVPRTPYTLRWANPVRSPDTSAETIYGDEIDRMPTMLRWRWFRSLAHRHATLVIGTHVDLSTVGRRAGFNVLTHRLGPIDHRTMQAMIDNQLRAAAVAGHSGPPITAAELDVELVMTQSRGIPGEANVVCHRILAQVVL